MVDENISMATDQTTSASGFQVTPDFEERMRKLVFAEVTTEKLLEQKKRETEAKIMAIQKSTRVSMPIFSSIHNRLRSTWPWYYNWHLNKKASALHVLILVLFLLALVARILSASLAVLHVEFLRNIIGIGAIVRFLSR